MEYVWCEKKGFLENYQYVFDPSGLYGGYQGSPQEDYDRYESIVRKYHHEYASFEINNVLRMLAGEEERFEEIFGYPMCLPNGKLNFYDLLVDFYCATDNHNRFLWFDRVDPKEDENCEKGHGNTVSSIEWRFETYMKKHGVSVSVKQIRVIPEQLPKILEKGPVIVSISPTVLYDKRGLRRYKANGGHCMSVTGLADNGLIRVSSSGREYYIKHGSYSELEYYQQILF